jgi:hypothetical protein
VFFRRPIASEKKDKKDSCENLSKMLKNVFLDEVFFGARLFASSSKDAMSEQPFG